MVGRSRFTGSWRQFKGELKRHWDQRSDSELLETEADYEESPGIFYCHGEEKKEIERWAEDWCERGGWRK